MMHGKQTSGTADTDCFVRSLLSLLFETPLASHQTRLAFLSFCRLLTSRARSTFLCSLYSVSCTRACRFALASSHGVDDDGGE